MAINQEILNPNTNWEDKSKGYIEDGLKELLRAMLAELENPTIAAGSVGVSQLTQALRDIIDGKVPNTRTINSKPLSGNVSLNANDVGALPAGTPIPRKTSDLDNDSGFITEEDLPETATIDQSLNPNSQHAVSNAAVCTGLSTKANDNAVVKSVSVNGTAQTKDTHGNVNVVVPTVVLDDAPTAGSSNGVKSGGVKTALDNVMPTINENGKWVIGGVATDKDAQGPRGNTVLVNENAVGIQGLIVNNVSDGGETEMLSAEMGKVIRQNIMRIYNALAPYAFPGGKPVLNWGSTVINCNINVNGVSGLTISDVEVDGSSVQSMPQQIVEGKSLSFKLNLPSNLYIYDTVAISMGGVKITNNQGVWDESTGEVNIAAVTDDVVVTATSITYVSSGLVMHLDGKNRGGVAGHWKSLVNYNGSPIDFTLTSCDETHDDYVGFDKNNGSKGVADIAMIDLTPANATIEVVYKDIVTGSSYFYVLANGLGSGNKILFAGSRINQAQPLIACNTLPVESNASGGGMIGSSSLVAGGQCSCYKNNIKFNGNSLQVTSDPMTMTTDANTLLALMHIKTSSVDETFGGKLYAVRIYSSQLSDAERAQNLAIDRKRFNLA